jgi:hypothetical protein
MPEARGEPPRRLNTLVGAGMLALPYAFAVQGWAVGMTTLLLAAFGSATGQMLLSVCAQRLHSRSTSYGACTCSCPTARFHWVLSRSATLFPAALHHRTLLRCAACFSPPALKPELTYSASPQRRDSPTPALAYLRVVHAPDVCRRAGERGVAAADVRHRRRRCHQVLRRGHLVSAGDWRPDALRGTQSWLSSLPTPAHVPRA